VDIEKEMTRTDVYRHRQRKSGDVILISHSYLQSCEVNRTHYV